MRSRSAGGDSVAVLQCGGRADTGDKSAAAFPPSRVSPPRHPDRYIRPPIRDCPQAPCTSRHCRHTMSTYIIGDNTGGKYIAAKDGEKTKDVLDVPTRLLGKGDKTGGLRLFHDLGAVYGLVDDSSGWGKEKFYMKATGSNAVLKTFEKWTGDKYDYANAWIPYTTHVERMILFSGKNGWTSDGKELKSTVKTDGMATWKFTAVELADGLVVFPLNAGYGSGEC